jgi:hypothetical protein
LLQVTKRSCSRECTGVGSLSFLGEPGVGQLKGACAAKAYAGSRSISDPMVSPLAAAAAHLAGLPPVMLVVGR